MQSKRLLTRKHTRPDRDGLKRFVAALPPAKGSLGLTHVTTGYLMREIIDIGSICAVDNCRIFGEPIIYAFYGRAAFRKSGDGTPTDLVSRMPVVFVLDSSKAPKPKYIFPFDTGAFMEGFLDDYLDQYMPLFDFILEPDVNTATKIAEFFFGDQQSYMDNIPKAPSPIPANQFEAHSVQRMILAGGRGANKLDDRASTVEFIFDKSLDIISTIAAIIMPADLAVDPELGGRMKTIGVRVDSYPWTAGTRPTEYHMQLRQMVRAIYKDFGWL